MRRRSMNASIRAAALSSSESTNSRAGTRPFGRSTYSIVNSLFTAHLHYRIIAIDGQRRVASRARFSSSLIFNELQWRGLTVCTTVPNVQITSFISEVMIKSYLNRVALWRPSVGYCASEKALGRFSCLCGSMRVLLRLETALRKSSFRYHEKSGRAARDETAEERSL